MKFFLFLLCSLSSLLLCSASAQRASKPESEVEVQFRVMLLGGIPEPRYVKTQDGTLDLQERDTSHLIRPANLRLASPKQDDDSDKAKQQKDLISKASQASFPPTLNRVGEAFRLKVPKGKGIQFELEASGRSNPGAWMPWAEVNLAAENLATDYTLLFFKQQPKDTWMGEKKPQLLVLNNAITEQFPPNSLRLINASAFPAIIDLEGTEIRLRARSATVVPVVTKQRPIITLSLSYLNEQQQKQTIRTLSKNFQPNSRAQVTLYNHDGDWGNFPIAMTYTFVAEPKKPAQEDQQSQEGQQGGEDQADEAP